MKRFLAILLALVLAVPIFWIGNPFSPMVKASADTYRKGYGLTAEKADNTGIFPDTGFILTVPQAELDAVSGNGSASEKASAFAVELAKRLVLRGGPAKTGTVTPAGFGFTTQAAFSLTIESAGKNMFHVKPAESLADNTLYFFDMTASDGATVTFAFQTRRDYGVVGTLPADKSSDVPIDTGIEIYFTHPGVTDLAKYFTLSPAADGRFETHGQTVVFIPRKPLALGTLYTVTVKKGLPLSGTDRTLQADLTFSFETNPDPGKSANPDGGYLGISSNWLEVPTSDKPIVPFDVSLPDSLAPGGKASLDVSVFRFADDKTFIKALELRDRIPYWAWYSYSQNTFPTNGLTKALSYKQPIDLTIQQSRFTELPETLAAGFYLIELQTGSADKPMKAQALLQVTDTTSWFIEDKSTLLFWVNSLKTGLPMAGVTVESLSTKVTGTTNAEGLASLDKKGALAPSADKPEYFRLRAADGSISILNSGYPVVTGSGTEKTFRYGYGAGPEGNFWRYAGLDRTLYKPSDTVRFWGFARSRLSGISPEKVTVEIAQGGYMYPWLDSKMGYWMPMIQKPLLSTTLPVKNGFWDGSLSLPALEPGYYTLTVKAGDETVASSGFSVENYIKPAYQLTATTDKKAVFPGQIATFTVTASFFDGTPVANQSIRYTIQEAQGNQTGEGKTNDKGELTIPYTAKYFDGQQGEFWASFDATSVLPESGEVTATSYLRVFMNDILVETVGDVVNADGTPKTDGKKDMFGRIKVTVNKADLAPLNDDDPDNDVKMKGASVPGQTFSGTVTRTTWERVAMGEDYDFINKVVVPRYEYREKKETVSTFTLTTGADGKGSWQFPIPAGVIGYYTAEFSTKDDNNHIMRFNTWHSPSGYDYPNQGTWYSLNADKSSYRIGDPVKASVERNDKEPVKGRTLFVASWNGIQSYAVANEPKYETVFAETMAPNLTLDGVVFDGRIYHAVQTNLTYDSEEKRITFETTTDKKTYRPGDTVTVTVKAKDPSGKPVPATINVALVDEAMFKLAEQYNDVLPMLYSWMDNGIIRRSGSGGSIYPMSYGGGIAMRESAATAASAMPAPSATDSFKGSKNGAADMAVGEADASYVVRSDFKDSAYFAVKTLDESGTGTLTFKIPDNVTSWRISVSGISQALQGGSGQGAAVVSLPFFLSETLNATYLAGDEPQVGFTAYGNDLKAGEDVTFNITSAQLPNLNASISAKAFERVHLPVGKLPEGTYTFTLKAKSASGLTDAMEKTVTVVGSFREMQKTVSVKLSDGMAIPAGTKGLTRLFVSDPARAELLQTLQTLAWNGGHRLDQRLVSASSQKWLNEIMTQGKTNSDGSSGIDGLWTPDIVDVGTYRRSDGGYGILPYAESDLRMTALLAGMLMENGNTDSLKSWLYGKAYASDNPPPAALYALAVLGEPVLMELNLAATVQTATLEDTLFIILGYAAVGDLPSARALWDAEVAPVLETAAPYVRVKNGTAGLSGNYGTTPASVSPADPKSGVGTTSGKSAVVGATVEGVAVDGAVAGAPVGDVSGKSSGTEAVPNTTIAVGAVPNKPVAAGTVSPSGKPVTPKSADGKDEALQFTALASAAAAALQLPGADDLHRWVQDNGSKNVYTGIEDLLYTKAQFRSLPAETLSFTWTNAGKANKEILENGNIAFIAVISAKASELVISDVSGNGMVTSTYLAPQEAVTNDTNLKLARTYINEGTGRAGTTFGMNDLIRVELDWDISSNAMDSTYEVTDYLPAGLTPIANPWQYGIRPAEGFWYRDYEGQKVNFVIGRDWDLQHKIIYYARVSSPGTYTAEGAVVQGSLVKSSQLEIPSAILTITAK